MEVTCDFLTVINDLPFNIEQVLIFLFNPGLTQTKSKLLNYWSLFTRQMRKSYNLQNLIDNLQEI